MQIYEYLRYTHLREDESKIALKAHPWGINATTAVAVLRHNNDSPSNGISSKMMVHIVPTPMIALLGIGCAENPGEFRHCVKHNVNKTRYNGEHGVFDEPFVA